MKTLSLLVPLLVLALIPATGRADGMFVAPKFVWDKHKDINEPTQKAIIVYDAGQEDLILQVKYEGPVDQFGWLIPVPNKPTVQKGSMKYFYELSQFTQQRLGGNMLTANSAGITDGMRAPPAIPPPVKVVETKTVGAYDIAVLSANDSTALKKWLDDNHYYLPPDKADVVDTYIKQQWYFVAVKINLRDWFPGLISTATRLASGELNPLQTTFASDHCVFPLKISSINGKPSEVSLYVLSPEPLLEKSMLEKQLPAYCTNDVARARTMAVGQERFMRTERSNNRRYLGANEPDDAPLSAEEEKAVQGMMKSLYPEPDELPPYFKVTSADLPECAGLIPSLASNAWWLTKQTWTFQPEEMRDLNFEPAMPAFASLLSSQYGYFANAGLAAFGSNAIPTIIEAMQNTNPAVRVTASGIFYGEYGSDWRYGYWNNEISLGDGRFITPALSWLKDPEPEVRKAGVAELALGNWNPEFSPSIIALLRDKDPDVRRFVIALLGSVRFANDLMGYIPQFMQMLKDPDLNTREAGLQILQHMNVQIPREDLLAFFKSSDYRTLDAAWAQLQNQGEKLSDNDILPLLQNPNTVAHLLALSVLGQNHGKQSVELALPLLQDPNEFVRLSANRTLCSLTGQEFSADEPDKWIQWWDANKAHFIAQNPGQ